MRYGFMHRTKFNDSRVIVVGTLRRVDVWPPLAIATKLSTSVATYSVAPSA